MNLKYIKNLSKDKNAHEENAHETNAHEEKNIQENAENLGLRDDKVKM